MYFTTLPEARSCLPAYFYQLKERRLRISLLFNSLYFIKKDQVITAFNLLHCFDLSKDQSQLKNKEKELKKLSDLLVKLEQTSQADSNAVQAAQDHFHAVSAGLSSNEGGEDKTLADQVMSMFTCAPVFYLNDKL